MGFCNFLDKRRNMSEILTKQWKRLSPACIAKNRFPQFIKALHHSKYETQLDTWRRCGFMIWNHLKSVWWGKSHLRRKCTPVIDLTVLWMTAVWNMTILGQIRCSFENCFLTALVGKHQVNLPVLKEEKTKAYSLTAFSPPPQHPPYFPDGTAKFNGSPILRRSDVH